MERGWLVWLRRDESDRHRKAMVDVGPLVCQVLCETKPRGKSVSFAQKSLDTRAPVRRLPCGKPMAYRKVTPLGMRLCLRNHLEA